MEKEIVEIFDASWRDLKNSTKEKRIVTLTDDIPHKIYDVGEQYNGSIFREYNGVAVVDMGVNKGDFTTVDQLISSDGIDIRARFSLNFNIIDDENAIRKAVVNFTGEKDLLLQSITVRLQKFIKSFKATDLRKETSNATTFLTGEIQDIEEECVSCFHIRNIIVSGFIIINSELNTIISKSIKDIESENAQNEIIKLKLENAHTEQLFKIKEAERQIQLENIKAKNELELDALKEKNKLEIEKNKKSHEIDLERQKLELEHLKHENEILIKLKQATAMETEQGMYAYFHQEMFNLSMKELELKLANNKDSQKILTQFLQLSLNNDQSYKSGQLNALRSFLSTHLNINLTEQNLDKSTFENIKQFDKLPFEETKEGKSQSENSKIEEEANISGNN